MSMNRRLYFTIKRGFDIILAAVGLIAALPFMLIIMAAIFLQDGLPLFFCDQRVGKNGSVFKMIKFRSMIKDAERSTGSVYSVKDDPRITPLGKVMRPMGIDEIPQLVNILKGEMSFVGPRPEKINYVETFIASVPDYGRRHDIRPGLTGPAQVYLKYDSSCEEKLKHDLLYVESANFLWDISLIFKSFVIALGRGVGSLKDTESSPARP